LSRAAAQDPHVSSYTGTSVDATPTDPGLQLAPKGEAGPDYPSLKRDFELCVSNLQPYVDQCRENYDTRFALWDGQSADGRKHAREGAKIDPTPWDGASDLRVFLTDEAVNAKVAMLAMAFRKAQLVAVPVEGNDLKRAKIVSNFMKWLVQTQIPEIDREVELLGNYLCEKGVAATGQFWEMTREKTLLTLQLSDLQAQFPEADVMVMLTDPAMTDTLRALFEEMYNCTAKKARKMIEDLRTTGRTTVPVAGREKSRPVVRAFNLDENLFIPNSSTDLETAPAVYRVQYFSAEQLRSFAATEGWDEKWVDAAISTCRGKYITPTTNEYIRVHSRSFNYIQEEMDNLIGVVYAYQRLSDEDGIPGIYLTVFTPLMGPDGGEHLGYAKHGLLGYAHGQYPFVIHRREFLSRRLHDSRGIPEVGKPIQDQIKVHKDSRIDAASLAILPPMGYPVGRPPARWGAGARIPERRPNEYHFLDRPMPDGNTEASETQLRNDFNRYLGFASATGDQQFALMKNQFETDKFMSSWSKAFRQIWSLYQQFGSEQVYFRVVGLRQQDPIQFIKGGQDEEYDFILNYQVESMDTEKTFEKIKQIAQIVATADREGVVDYSEWLQAMIEAIDPTIAERIIQPKDVGQQKVVGELQDMLAKVYAGQDQDIKVGTPPELGLQVIQGYVQGDPVVQQRMQNPNDPFGKRIEKLTKQLQFQVQQRENAKIGRLGA
jgi:hypothetical protein